MLSAAAAAAEPTGSGSAVRNTAASVGEVFVRDKFDRQKITNENHMEPARHISQHRSEILTCVAAGQGTAAIPAAAAAAATLFLVPPLNIAYNTFCNKHLGQIDALVSTGNLAGFPGVLGVTSS